MESELKKILIIDDDSFLLDMYALKFMKSNFSVSTALGPEKALEKLKEGFSPDIILLDIMMPVMDGFELLEKLKARKNCSKFRCCFSF
jgi:CheY-like chemotaxis protein